MIPSVTLPDEFLSCFSVDEFPKLSNSPSTRREPYKYNARGGAGEYLVVYALTDVQRFYLDRSLLLRKEVSQHFEEWFQLNELLWDGELDKGRAAVYLKIDSSSQPTLQAPVEYLLNYYELLSETRLTEEGKAQILDNFLEAWPRQYHTAIQSLSEFSKFEEQLSLLESTKLCLEHGDYTLNNMGVASGHSYLFDFEFVKRGQPIGFDLYDLLISSGKLSSFKGNIPNASLNSAKYTLVNSINQMVDGEKDGVIVFKAFSQRLSDAWIALWEKLPYSSYNLHPDWCRIWFESFGKKYTLYILTYWNDGVLEGVFPLYIHRNHLCMIGAYPDLYDCAEPLYTNKNNLSKFVKYIVATNYDLDMRYLATEQTFCRLLFKEIYSHNFFYISKFVDLKPRINFSNYKVSKKLRYDARRCVNRIQKEKSMTLSCKQVHSSRALQDFIALHRKRWSGGPFDFLSGLKEFIERIYVETELLDLCALGSDECTVAYHLGYRNSDKSMTSAMPAFDPEYQAYSPGKVLLYQIVMEEKESKPHFDFGRGAEPYKYWFSNEEDVLVHIKTYRRLTFLKTFSERLTSLLRKIFG